ncbi:MAG: bifunctional precorrin-2 dehydrogenase/sirohydrochlorin ferrochelatase [Candidatus Acidiferrales bacterium]
MPANLLPIFVKLAGRKCLVAGAGTVAEAKIASLLEAEAEVWVVAPQANEGVGALASSGALRWEQREFQASDLDGIFMAIAATSDPDVNASIFEQSRQRSVICNSVDDPPHCDFYFSANVRRGDLQVAISTAGESPAVAQRLRDEIERALDPGLGEWLEDVGALRREILARYPASEERKRLLQRLAYREVGELSGRSAEELESEPASKIADEVSPENVAVTR